MHMARSCARVHSIVPQKYCLLSLLKTDCNIRADIDLKGNVTACIISSKDWLGQLKNIYFSTTACACVVASN